MTEGSMQHKYANSIGMMRAHWREMVSQLPKKILSTAMAEPGVT
jgi:hypothetical protein